MSIQCERMSKSYGNHSVLKELTVSFQEENLHVLVGENGAGKTTLLRMLAGLLKPCSGYVTAFGERLNDALIRDKGIIYVPNKPWLFSGSVFDNVDLPLKMHGIELVERRGRIDKGLETFDLAHLAKRHASTLSAGEGQKLALLRAMLLKPSVLLLDEPTSNLDEQTVPLLEAYIKSYSHEANKTIIMVSHDRKQTERMADRVWHLKNGVLWSAVSVAS